MDTDQTIKLVVAVEKRPFLYDKSDPGYSNRNLLNAEWKKIAEEIGCNETETRKRWKKLRDYFLKIHREITACKSGSAGGQKKKKWFLYDRLLFILPFISDRRTTTNVTAISSDEAEDNGDDNMSQASLSSFTFVNNHDTSTPKTLPPNNTDDCENTPSTSKERPPMQMQPKFPQNRKRKPTDFEAEMLRAAQRLGERKETEKKEELDEDELFLKSLVPKMKRMDIANKMACQGKMLNIVLEHIMRSEASTERSSYTSVREAPERYPNRYSPGYSQSQSPDEDARIYQQYPSYSTAQPDMY